MYPATNLEDKVKTNCNLYLGFSEDQFKQFTTGTVNLFFGTIVQLEGLSCGNGRFCIQYIAQYFVKNASY